MGSTLLCHESGVDKKYGLTYHDHYKFTKDKMEIGNLILASVEEEYNKNKELRNEDVQYLLDWANQQPHFPKITELEVIVFYHACMFSQESTKNVMDVYFTCRTHVPEFFSNRIASKNHLTNMDLCVFHHLEELTPDGTAVVYVKLVDTSVNNFNFAELVKIFTMVGDLYIAKHGSVAGHAILFNLEGATLSHLARLGIMTIKKFVYYLQDCMPIRKKGVHYVNVVPWMDKIMALIKPFLNPEIQDIIYIHTKIDTVYKHIPKKMLPKDLGGEGPSDKQMQAMMKKELTEHSEFFQEEEKTRRINEKLRPGKAKNANVLFGIEGSFKKLDID